MAMDEDNLLCNRSGSEASVSDTTGNLSVSNDSDDSYDYYGDYYNPTIPETIAWLSALGAVLLVGIVGNSLVVAVIVGVKSMQTTVNKCLLLLTLVDILILVFVPITLVLEDFTDATVPVGEHFCDFLALLDRGACFCSVLIFFFVTTERYVALCHPMKSKRFHRGRKTLLALVVIILISSALALPYVSMTEYEVYTEDMYTQYYCSLIVDDGWETWYDFLCSVFVYFLPLPFLTVLYARMIYAIRNSVPRRREDNSCNAVDGHRGRSQVVVMLLIVVFVYCICQLPFVVLVLLNLQQPDVFMFYSPDGASFHITWACRLLIFVNSAFNPILYFSVSSNFRYAFTAVFCYRRRAITTESVSSPPRTSSTASSYLGKHVAGRV